MSDLDHPEKPSSFHEKEQTIAIAANFTAEPVGESLRYWIEELELPAKVEFAPYNQVLQQLLDPTSLLRSNQRGINVVLLRLEDLNRDIAAKSPLSADPGGEIDPHNLREVLDTLKSVASGSGMPYLVCICPPSQSANAGRASSFEQMEQLVEAELSQFGHVRVLTVRSFSAIYPIDGCHDARSDELGHIPYTSSYFAALGTMICRHFCSVVSQRHKAIVLDCDNTLWAGVCGEDGPAGVRLEPPYKSLQELMRAQHNAGMLLCVCSKNAEEDVEAVFEHRQDMPLHREHIAAWRVNWERKSANVKSLARELGLGLDSFIFIDDNPMECAEVEAGCPEVLVLQLPENPELIPQFLRHVWAFDQAPSTQEDERRTALYAQNRERAEFRKQFVDLADFIAGLDLKIEIKAMKSDQLPRVAQLTQRTNQFNFTTRRRTEVEMENVCRSDSFGVLTVSVSDRFGDYGLVGVVIHKTNAESLTVETFLLSCRVLGKGVEYRMLACLGQIAQARGLTSVDLLFRSTPKNKPAMNFLLSVRALLQEQSGDQCVFRLPAALAAEVCFDPNALSSGGLAQFVSEPAESGSVAPVRNVRPSRARQLALQARDAGSILEAMRLKRGWVSTSTRGYQAPETKVQQQLAGIWKRLLRVEEVGIHDDFVELGGDSLSAVLLFAQVQKLTGVNLPMATLFEAPTIEKLAALLEQEGFKAPWHSLVAIKASGSSPPFYCVHGVGGNILEYRDLARYMDADQPFYGIQAVGLDGRQPNVTVEEMAAHYIEEITSFQPRGPYYMGGSSFGGLVAYEMARQLHAQGERVALLALFDTNGPGYPQVLPATTVWEKRLNAFRHRVNLHLGNFIATEPKRRLEYVLEKARRWKNATVRVNRARLIGLKTWAEERIDRLFWPKAIRQVNRAGHWAAGDYVPKEYAGHVTLFRATEQPLGIIPDRTLGWGPLVKGGLDIYDTPGHHGTLVREPRARLLSEQLKDSMRKAKLHAMAIDSPVVQHTLPRQMSHQPTRSYSRPLSI
jgi:FkbH-like protein